MNILILTAATGGGHLRAARAVRSYVLENTDGSSVEVEDALKNIGAGVDKTICDGYRILATKAPALFGHFYRLSNRESSLSDIVWRFSSSHAKKLLPLIRSHRPDIIISTHPFVTEMVSYLKGEGLVTVPLICIMTDYGPHKAWIADHVDAYVVSNEDMVPKMEDMGVPNAKIYPFGIPVENVFFTKSDKETLQERFGLTPKLPVVLIMAGSFGVSKVLRIYRQISRSSAAFQIVVITGRNKRLYSIFQKKITESPKKTKLVFFTNEVENYMRAADLLVTKPGGLTVSEALACNIPMAVFDAIPGQEEDNADFLISHHMAVKLGENDGGGDVVGSLLKDSAELNGMRSSCEGFDKSHSAANILSLINILYENSKAMDKNPEC